tara:strand:- start:48864 stop:50903 length:2040 start_codon:yes stop_codon:yes gene_type:complete
MKIFSLFFICLSPCLGSVIYFNNGKNIEGNILEANSTHLLFQRAKDLQQFRFKVDLLTEDSRKQLELYHAENRYSSIPTLPTPLDERTLKKYSGYIDTLIEANLRNKRLQKTKEIDEYTYVRRLYLTTIGRIPTHSEITDFTSDRDKNKRDKLIQKLLNSNGYVNHQINWWSDMLRIKDRVNGTNINVGIAYRKWLRQAIEEHSPYDKIVRDLVGSTGKLYENKQGAAISYYLRDRGMQPDNLSHTIRIFLGTRLECAMCHNHPFDKWSQKEFYEMTAFTSGIGNVRLNKEGREIGVLSKAINDDADSRAGLFNNWRNQVRDSLIFGLDNNGTGQIKLPVDFAEDDGNPGDTVYAKAIFTPKPVTADKKKPQSRKVFADWISSKDNPRFTTMIANRIWKNIFGAGLIEPIDTMMDDTLASNEPLMKYLERILVSVNYDLREYQRILLNTKLFQRACKKEDYKSLEEYNFEGPILRRMSGEQLWDSLVTLVYNDIDSAERAYTGNQPDYSVMFNRYKEMNGTSIYNDFKMLSDANPGERNLYKLINENSYVGKKFSDRNLIRSSYLSFPAPGGHLIRQFGGSDKEQIDNSNSEPNTTQVLNLLNGFVENNILNKKDADFIKQIQSEKVKTKQIESVFLSILGRKATSREYSAVKGFIDEENGFKHVSWILLNSHEFIFIK